MRQKNRDWFSTDKSWDNAHAQILQDIRDELQKLNRVFECHNFLMIPHRLKEIARNTKRRKKKANKLKI